jgi:hypothetical protein
VSLKLNSCQIGKTAFELLTAGTCGRVLAGFSRAAYLVTEQAELFWLTSEKAPMHLRGMRIAGSFPKIVAGENFFIKGRCITIASDLKVDFGDASLWSATTISAETAPEIEKIHLRVKNLFPNSFDVSQASGFGLLIPKILSVAPCKLDDELDDKAEIDPVLALAWLGIHEIAKACLLRDMPGIFQGAGALVGLGGGLTPSGDDFLGGLLFCVNCIQRLYPGFIDLDVSEQALFIESARKRTHLISFTLLKDMTAGRAAEPLHEFVHSIFSDQPPEGICPASSLTRIGHSTGWDLLTGVLTGLLLTFPFPDSTDSSAVAPAQVTNS